MAVSNQFSSLSPAEQGYLMPAETDPHAACWMAFPSAHIQWDDLAAVEADYASVANAIAQFEPVINIWLLDSGC